MRVFNSLVLKCFLFISFVFISSLFSSDKSHGISISNDLKYKKDFSHFDYTNPKAKKGGHFKEHSLVGSFDNLNQFTIKGVKASRLDLIYDTLMTSSLDEKFSMYGLVAKSIELDDENKWVKFELRDEARFSDGESIDAIDVKFTFDILTKVNPIYKQMYQDVKEAKVISTNVIKFIFSNSKNVELPLILAQLPVLPKHYWIKKDFSKTTLIPPIGSGPYIIDKIKAGKFITYKRNENYWGKNLNVNKGFYNFDKITIIYFRDKNVALEAFKSGEYDFVLENIAKNWATSYKGANFDKKLILKEEIKHSNPQGMQGFVFNTRKDMFQDIRVRKAIGLAFDFEWINKSLFFSQYTRSSSYFENSDLKSTGLPSKEELKYLNPIKKHIPKEVFSKEFKVEKSRGDGNIRERLKEANKLLKEAGYKIKNSVLVNSKNKPFKIEFLVMSHSFVKVLLPFKKNLKRLGIDLNIKRIDVSQYLNRLRKFDYDMMTASFPQSNWLGNEQRFIWHSSSLKEEGSRNYIGVNNQGVDYLVDKLISNQNKQNIIAKALDRVLLANYFVVTNWYMDKYRISYWSKLKQPNILPKYGFTTNNWWIDANTINN